MEKYIHDLPRIRAIIAEFGNEKGLFRFLGSLSNGRSAMYGGPMITFFSKVNAIVIDAFAGIVDEKGKPHINHSYGICAIGACYFMVHDPELLSAALLNDVAVRFPKKFTREYLVGKTTHETAFLVTALPESNCATLALQEWKDLYWLAMETEKSKGEPDSTILVDGHHLYFESPNFESPTIQ
jgi:hypothetical protein